MKTFHISFLTTGVTIAGIQQMTLKDVWNYPGTHCSSLLLHICRICGNFLWWLLVHDLMAMAVWISCAVSDLSLLSLHHHNHHHHRLVPRTDQSRLEPALIWEIHIAEAAAGWPRGWHCRHLVMTTTSGLAQTRVMFEDTRALDRSIFSVCHGVVMSITLDGKLLLVAGLLCDFGHCIVSKCKLCDKSWRKR